MTASVAEIRLPDWLARWPLPPAPVSDAACMQLAVTLSRENVALGGGGPFGAVLRSDAEGGIAGVGVNLVTSTANPVLHAEVVAISLARLGEHAPPEGGLIRTTLFCSCEPCIMCLGASHWAGIQRIVSAALREDAEGIGFAEGAGVAQLRAEMAARGVRFEAGPLRREAVEVLRAYVAKGGRIYGPAAG